MTRFIFEYQSLNYNKVKKIYVTVEGFTIVLLVISFLTKLNQTILLKILILEEL